MSTIKTIESLGERGFLSRLLPVLKSKHKNLFVVPPGDDAAVLTGASKPVLSIDGLTEGTHFRRRWRGIVEETLKQPYGRLLGWKLMNGALSDLAAMGSTRRRWALVYMAAPRGLDEKFLWSLVRGIQEAAERAQCVVAGGDTVRAGELSLVAAVGGDSAPRARALVRSGARAGDLICVGGVVGDAVAGLGVLEGRHASMAARDRRYFMTRFFDSRPLFSLGALLSTLPGVSACLDVSDSMAESMSLLCEASRCGANVDLDRLAVSAPFRRAFPVYRAYTQSGEDYALLFTAEPKTAALLASRHGVRIIGRIRPRREGLITTVDGKKKILPAGFRHF